jgi:hypothetical protein
VGGHYQQRRCAGDLAGLRVRASCAVGGCGRCLQGWSRMGKLLYDCYERSLFTNKSAVHFARRRRRRRSCCCWCSGDWGCHRAMVAICRERGSGIAVQVFMNYNQVYCRLNAEIAMSSKHLHTSNGMPFSFLVKPIETIIIQASQTPRRPTCGPYVQPAATLLLLL